MYIAGSSESTDCTTISLDYYSQLIIAGTDTPTSQIPCAATKTISTTLYSHDTSNNYQALATSTDYTLDANGVYLCFKKKTEAWEYDLHV